MLKDKLMDSLKIAAANYNSGTSANVAVAKAAEDADFNEKQAERLVEMFNTLAALNKEQDKEDPTGNCELASKEAVVKMLINGCETKKAAAYDDPYSHDYSFYDVTPQKTNCTIEAKDQGHRVFFKSASFNDGAIPEELRVSQRSLYKIIEGKIDHLRKTAAAADDVIRNLRLDINSNVVKIAKAIEDPFADNSLADMFKAACKNKKVLDLVSEYSTKVAESAGGEYSSLNVFNSSAIDDLLTIANHVEKEASEISNYESKRDYYNKQAELAEEEMRDAIGLHKAATHSLCEMVSAPIKSRATAIIDKRENLKQSNDIDVDFCTKVASLIRESEATPDSISNIGEMLEKDAAPRLEFQVPNIPDWHDALIKMPGGIDGKEKKLLNVRRSMILADLMTNDPIIRDADPNTVVESYKTIVMASPRVSLDKAQVRAFLRSAVNSVAVSPSDVKTIADVDKGISFANVDRLTLRDSSIKDSNLY